MPAETLGVPHNLLQFVSVCCCKGGSLLGEGSRGAQGGAN